MALHTINKSLFRTLFLLLFMLMAAGVFQMSETAAQSGQTILITGRPDQLVQEVEGNGSAAYGDTLVLPANEVFDMGTRTLTPTLDNLTITSQDPSNPATLKRSTGKQMLVLENVTLILKDIIFDGGKELPSSSGAGAIDVTRGLLSGNEGKLIIEDGTILQNFQSIVISNDGKVIINGGRICDNQSLREEGIAINNFSYFEMNGGRIYGNRAYSGSAVANICYGADTIFEMKGGIIGDEKASTPGYDPDTEARAEVSIEDAEICYNYAWAEGGGIFNLADTERSFCKAAIGNGADISYNWSQNCGGIAAEAQEGGETLVQMSGGGGYTITGLPHIPAADSISFPRMTELRSSRWKAAEFTPTKRLTAAAEYSGAHSAAM